jgi:hypothetical protein
MTTATARPVKTGEFIANPIDLDEHKAELERLREQQAKASRRVLHCSDPKIAAAYENKKPVYLFNVHLKWERIGRKRSYEVLEFEETVAAQNERDAWALFCDKSKHPQSKNGKPVSYSDDAEPRRGPWPSRRSPMTTVTIEQGEQIDAARALAMLGGDAGADLLPSWEDD